MGKNGGGTPAPTQATSYQTNIPEYAKPYVTNMLNATQGQLFNTGQNAEGNTEITGFKPYKPYSSNPSDYYAGFSPLQQQAQSSAANLQTPGQFGQGSAMTGIAGLRSMQAGQDFQNMATNPNAVGAYMNPYLQNSLQPQLEEMQRQYGITGTQQASQATQQGAFGGGRDAIMAAENARNKNMAMNQAIGQGYNTAFNNAQQQMNAGAQLNLQGLGQAGQAGASLANIGGQQLAAQQGIIGTQNQLGGQQQALEQSKINQAVQDYATAQQYPMMQLGMMSNMLRGLPMQATAVQSYQAQAPVAQQAAGLLGAYNAYTGKKEGGAIKAMAKGGIADVIPGYKSGVLARIDDTLEDISQADMYAQPSQKQLPRLMQQTQSPGIKQLIATKQAEDQIGQNISGVAAGNTGDLGINMAEGGIVPRFAKGTAVKEDPYGLNAAAEAAAKGYATPEEALQTQQRLMASGLQNVQANLSPEEIEYQNRTKENRTNLPEKQRRAERLNEALAFLKFGSTPGGLGTAAIEAGKDYMVGQGSIEDKFDERNNLLAKEAAEMAKGRRAEAKGDIVAAQGHYEKATKFKLEALKDSATIASAEKIARERNQTQLAEAAMRNAGANMGVKTIAEEKAAIRKDLKEQLGRDPTTAEVLSAYTAATKQGDESLASRAQNAAALDYGKFLNNIGFDPAIAADVQKAARGDKDAAVRVEKYKQDRKAEIFGNYGVKPNAASPPPPPQNNPLPQIHKTPDGQTLYLHPDGKYYTNKPVK